MSTRRRPIPAPRGMTLLELLVAVAITVVAGLALSTVMTTMARSITSSADSRSALQRAHAAYVRLRAFTDPGLCLLQHEPDEGFVIWLDDNKASTTVNLREMRAFWFDDQTGLITVERVEFPSDWPAELQDDNDVSLSNGANFLSEMLVQRGKGYTKSEVLCDGVLAGAIEHDAAADQAAKTIRFTLTMDDRGHQPPAVLTVHAFPDHTEPR